MLLKNNFDNSIDFFAWLESWDLFINLRSSLKNDWTPMLILLKFFDNSLILSLVKSSGFASIVISGFTTILKFE